MSYLSLQYVALVLACVFLYYVVPRKFRWIVLLAGSGTFYYFVSGSTGELILFGSSIVLSFGFSLLIYQQIRTWHYLWFRRIILALAILITTGPLLLYKLSDLFGATEGGQGFNWIIPVGLSFYSMQIAAYLIDIFRGYTKPTKNIFKYALFISFFPQIIQGPIPRYRRLQRSLFGQNRYDSAKFMGGVQLILWGLFLKYMIADKVSIVVDRVFGEPDTYQGTYIFIAGLFYCIQLYCDFLSCVSLSRGVAGLFGVELDANFAQPFFADSVKSFWRRWHISLSTWFRDYIYIPLGGNRRGRLLKYLALLASFGVSGIWHGSGPKFLVWGLIHAGVIILCDLLPQIPGSGKIFGSTRIIKILVTDFVILLTWIIFRADSLDAGFDMISRMFSTFNPWILIDHSMTRLGLSDREYLILFISLLILFAVSFAHERGVKIRQWFMKQNILLKWAVYLGVIWSIWIFGTYGVGFNAQDFIYGGF